MIEINNIYKDENEAKAFIGECEAAFEKKLSDIAADIMASESVRYLTLAGPTCSGKTTTAEKLTFYFSKGRRHARVISIDDFYYEKAEMDALGVTDIEGPEAINTGLFRRCVEKLSKRLPVCLPTFDFTTRTRAALTEYIPRTDDIYIFEGIQAVYPEITDVIKPYGTKGIFINVSEDAEVLGNRFEKNDLRLMRRTVRDYYHRGATVELTMQLWGGVRDNEERNIFPMTSGSDYIINSMLPYEIFLISDYYRAVTNGYPKDAVMADKVYALREKLSCTDGSAVKLSMIPEHSVFREFVV